MTMQEAKKELGRGLNIAHVTFKPGEYILLKNGNIIHSDGTQTPEEKYWMYRQYQIFELGWKVQQVMTVKRPIKNV